MVALPTEPIDEKVAELNGLGRATGGSAVGYLTGRHASYSCLADVVGLG